MAYKFKKLSAVEAVETVDDTANVLIEENGVIKKAPKNKVGGAGGIIINIRYEDDLKVTAPEGLYKQLETMFDTQVFTSDISVWYHEDDQFYYQYLNYLYRTDNGEIVFFTINSGSYIIEVYPDGSLGCSYND